MNIINKRTPKRKSLIFYPEVKNLDNSKFSANMINISTSGIMLSLKKKVKSGIIFRLELVLPDEIDGRDRIQFTALCKWCQEDINPDLYAAGFEFEEIEDDDIGIIVKMIYEYGFINS